MWSFFFLDMRLKTLKKDVKEIYSDIALNFKKDFSDKDETFINLMRGMSKFAWEQQLKMVEKGLLTKDELIMVMSKRDHSKISSIQEKYDRAVDIFLKDDWVKLTT